MKKWLFLLFRVVLGAVFIAASADKLLHPAGFAIAIYKYQVLPDFLINLAAIILPCVELLLGLALLTGLWLPGAVLIVNGLLVTFLSVLIFNLARGVNVHCGCFSTAESGDPLPLWYLCRDTSFLLMGVYLLVGVFFPSRVGAAASNRTHKI